MKGNVRVFECNEACDANMGGKCMWKIDEELSELAKDKNYKMCEKLRKAVLGNGEMYKSKEKSK